MDNQKVKPNDIAPPKGERFERSPSAVELQWIDILERKGPESVRMMLSGTDHAGTGLGANVLFLDVVYENKRHKGLRWFAEAWLAEKDKQSQARSNLQHSLLKVTVVGTIVAAIASVTAVILTIVLHFWG